MKDNMTKTYVQYLLRALRELGLVESPQRGMYLITKKGREILQSSEKTGEKDE